MARIQVQVGREIPASPARVFDCIADFARHRPNWLPPNYTDLHVEEGGRGAGTVVAYRLKVGPRERAYRMRIAEPAAGSVLTESDLGSSLTTTWTVTARGTNAQVDLSTQWQGSGGMGGFFERLFAPRSLQRVYEDELARLARYAADRG